MTDNTGDEASSMHPTERLSCTTCRQRKVRCDRVHPCSNCVKAGFQCTFPAGRRRPKEGRQQLALRLQKLESHIQDLASSLTPRHNSQKVSLQSDFDSSNPLMPRTTTDEVGLTNDIGKLSIDSHRSLYSSNALWSTLSQEIAEMQDLLQSEDILELHDKELSSNPSEPSSQGPSPGDLTWFYQHLPLESAASESLPPVLDKSMLWTAYVENVAPLIRIFHLPTMRQLWQEATTGLRGLTEEEDVAFDAIYFCAAVSLSANEVRQLFKHSKDEVLQYLQQTVERGFRRMDLLNTRSTLALQAWILYLITLRRLDDTRMVLSLLGIAARLALSLGLHRDGSKFKVPVFDAEMRRRIWWQLVLLDFEMSSDHGVEPLLQLDAADTNLPTNIDDEALHAAMTEIPSASQAFTGMSQSLVRLEISITARKMLYQRPLSPRLTLKQQRAEIESLQEQLKTKYLRYCSSGIGLQWATTVVAHSKVTILWVTLYHQLQHTIRTADQALRDKMMTAVTEIVEDVRDLESNSKTAHWGWYFHNDIQWPAIVYLLNEIIQRPPGPMSDHAWDILKRARDHWYENAGSKLRLQGMLFKPMRTLTNRAFWVKEGKQPPSGRFVDKDETPLSRLTYHDMPTDPFDMINSGVDPPTGSEMPDSTELPPQIDIFGQHAGPEAISMQIDDFMDPIWDQDWQFLTNAPT